MLFDVVRSAMVLALALLLVLIAFQLCAGLVVLLVDLVQWLRDAPRRRRYRRDVLRRQAAARDSWLRRSQDSG